MGLFITFEGGDGGGKGTQSLLLWQRLLREGYKAILTREPGGQGVEIAEQIREMLLAKDNQNMVAETEALLYFAARAQHIRDLIRPSLKQDITVVCERFNDSTIAYQGYGRELNLQVLKEIAQFASGGLIPDITFLLDIDPKIGLARKNPKVFDRLEQTDSKFHERVWQGYKILACGNPRFCIVDAERPIDEIAEKVWGKVEQLLVKER